MDVSAAKAKAIIDAAAGSKQKSTAEQLMGDFSAAVAERMKMSGQSVAEHRKASLAETMSAHQAAKPGPKADAQTVEAAPRDDHQPRKRAEAPEPPHDDALRPIEGKSDAPNESVQQDAPRYENAQNDRGDDGANQQQNASDNNQGQNQDASEQHTQSSDDGTADASGETATDSVDAQTDVGQGDQVVAAVVDMIGKTDTTQVTEIGRAHV